MLDLCAVILVSDCSQFAYAHITHLTYSQIPRLLDDNKSDYAYPVSIVL